MSALFRKLFRRQEPDGVRALKLTDFDLECVVMSEFSRMESEGYRVNRDVEVVLARRVANAVSLLYEGPVEIKEYLHRPVASLQRANAEDAQSVSESSEEPQIKRSDA